MTLSPVEAVDLLRFADALSQRLEQASADLSRKRGLEREKQWLEQASGLLREALGHSTGLLDRARGLPEMAELREELAGSMQDAWVDALEKLLAGITFHVSSRSPIIEALFPTQKLPPLRRAPSDAVRTFHSDFEKRLKSGYVTRMLASEDFAFARPVIDGVREAYARWHSCFEESAIPETEAASIREALLSAAERVELAARQARHLAEAALAPIPGAFEEHQLAAKPKKRSRAHAQAAAPANETAPADELPGPLDPGAAEPHESGGVEPPREVAAEPQPTDETTPLRQADVRTAKKPRRRKPGASAETG
ncbi:MAG TPA: hypothetical protein VE782_11725 [Myxococcaceae bacterium]|nr:hypothetical protein [Myxococcaceae bacterium]